MYQGLADKRVVIIKLIKWTMETILFPLKGRLKMDETDPLLKVSHPAAGNPGGELLKENSSLAKSRQAKGKSFLVAVG